jgi:hypothetical protein
MSAVLLAVFTDHESADRVRTELVLDGFPTDRVELTACCEPGRAGCQPAASLHDKFVQYFTTLFCREDERRCAVQLAERVDGGAATITVHPRGAIETARATEILQHAGPVEIDQHDLANLGWERAAASHEGPWMRNFWLESLATPECDCIYCRFFQRLSTPQ